MISNLVMKICPGTLGTMHLIQYICLQLHIRYEWISREKNVVHHETIQLQDSSGKNWKPFAETTAQQQKLL